MATHEANPVETPMVQSDSYQTLVLAQVAVAFDPDDVTKSILNTVISCFCLQSRVMTYLALILL